MSIPENELGNLQFILQYVEESESSSELTTADANSNELHSKRPRPSSRLGGKRSKKACSTCRTRKVRCNVSTHGKPCSNCQYDNVDCTIPQKYKRPRGIFKRNANNLKTDGNVNKDSAEKRRGNVELPRSCSSEESESLQVNGRNSTTECQVPDWQENSRIFAPSCRTISWVESPLASNSDLSKSSSLDFSLAAIFSPLPSNIGTRDREYLASHDALTLPSEGFQVELLKAYVDFVHPALPVLDLVEFLTIVKFGNKQGLDDTNGINPSTKKVNLLLFQAVMFAAVGYVGSCVLKEAGYTSRQVAKKVFFNRVKLLYNFDICTDRLTTIQSLLLMTLCPTNRTSTKVIQDAGHWLDLAISLSYVLGLNRDITLPNQTPREKHLERRIWWIAFIRDRTLSMRSNHTRRLVIAKEDCHIEMLCLDDFDLEQGTVEYVEYEGSHELRMKVIAVDCVEKAMMCWCTDDSLIFKRLDKVDITSICPPLSSSSRDTEPDSPQYKDIRVKDIRLRKEDKLEPSSLSSWKLDLLSLEGRQDLWMEADPKAHRMSLETISQVDIMTEYDDYFEYIQHI